MKKKTSKHTQLWILFMSATEEIKRLELEVLRLRHEMKVKRG